MLTPHYWALAALGLLAAVGLAVWYRSRADRWQRKIFNLMILVEQKSHGEARYRDLFENASDALFVTDLDGNLIELNRKAEALIGYDNAAARTVNLRSLLPGTPESAGVVQRWLNGEADGEQIEMIGHGGERVPVEVSTRLIEEAGTAVGIQAIARDVRERDALERQLRQSQKMDAVGQLAGGVAHDFNNLLTVIRGNGALVLEELPEGDPIRHDVQQINEAADRASVLTRQLLAFSRKQVVQPRALELNRLLHELERMLQRLVGADFAILTVASSDPAHVVADPGQLEQVVLNLVVNARDAMPDGGTITIETRLIALGDTPQTRVHSQSGRLVTLSVTDTGIGMSAATQARIFEPFFTTKEVGKGTGLGLSTVFGIVQQSNGEITCTSQPGRGTTFEIVLPYVASAAPTGAATDPLVAAIAGTESILLVEDEDEVRTLTARVLRRAGYEVIEARHAEEALGAAHDYPYHLDLLLSDIVLPGMNGLALSGRLTRSRPTLRVLLMSGYTSDEIVRRGIGELNIEYLQKPFTPHSLAVKVRAVLDAPGSTDQSAAVA